MKSSFEIDVTQKTKKHRISALRLQQTAEKILKHLGFKQVALSILLTNDSQIRKINREFLGHDWATDVVTLSALPDKKKVVQESTLMAFGDIIISLDTAKREAKSRKHSFFYETSFYLCHGILHMLGRNDETPAKRSRMLKKQEEILRKVLDCRVAT